MPGQIEGVGVWDRAAVVGRASLTALLHRRHRRTHEPRRTTRHNHRNAPLSGAVASRLIKQDNGEALTVKLGRIDPPPKPAALAVGGRIHIQAAMRAETTTGGVVKTAYTTSSREKLNPAT